MGAGRPSKYKKKYCKLLIEHCSTNGNSFASFCAKHEIGRTTFQRWVEEHSEFRVAKELASDIQQEFFEKLALANAAGTKGAKNSNSSMIQFILARRFKDYRSQQYIESNTKVKSEIEAKVEATVSTMDEAELAEEMARRLERSKLREKRKVENEV